MSEHYPFSAVGAALLCSWTDDDYGMGPVHWLSDSDDGESFRATIGSEDARNVLRVHESPELDKRLAIAAVRAALLCLDESPVALADIDAVIASPARRGFRSALAGHLGMPIERIIVAEDEKMHTASLAAALDRALNHVPIGARVILVAAGAGITAGAALYREPPIPNWTPPGS